MQVHHSATTAAGIKGNTMKRHLIPELLSEMIMRPQIDGPDGCAAAVGVSARQVHEWLVQSRQGHPAFQEVEWMGVKAPLHVLVDEGVHALTARMVISSALQRALNGTKIPSLYQGAPVWEEDEAIVASGITDPDELEVCFGQRDKFKRDTQGNRIQVMQHLKPSENLVIKIMESWERRRYGQHSTIDVKGTVGHLMQLARPGEDAAVIEQKSPGEVFSSDLVQKPDSTRQLALGRPAKDSKELEEWNERGEFQSGQTTFKMPDGSTVVIGPAIDPIIDQPVANRMQPQPDAEPAMRETPPMAEQPKAPASAPAATAGAYNPATDPRLQDQPGDSPSVRQLKALARQKPANPLPGRPVMVGKPEDEPTQPADRAGMGRGGVAKGGFKVG